MGQGKSDCMGWGKTDGMGQNDCTPRKNGELSEYTDSSHTEVEDLSSRYMNGSKVYDRCGHNTRQLHPSCTACRRTANLPGLA